MFCRAVDNRLEIWGGELRERLGGWSNDGFSEVDEERLPQCDGVE
jgi:hypothetical protein